MREENIIYIIKFISIYIFALVIFTGIYFTLKNKSYKTNGALGVNKKNQIIMIYSIKSFFEYYKSKNRIAKFYRNCIKFINQLDYDVEYTTETHRKILGKMSNRKEIEIISKDYSKKRRLLIPKLLICNFENLLKKEEFYKIRFKKVKKS